MHPLRHVLLAAFFGASAVAQSPPNAFDLADACRGGDGTFPGTGTMDEYPINRGGFALPPAGYTFVVGTFPVLANGPSDITDPAGTNPLQFDFSAFVGNTQSNGGPANGLATGTLAINDPSNLAGNPDYTGDPANHSIMMCHASVGITFDLNAIRAVFPNFGWFVANAGSSCNPTGYVVLVDGELRASGGGTSGNQFERITVPIESTASLLTLASTDNNSGTINCAHAFYGDPWLVPSPATAAHGSLGGGCPNPMTGPPRLAAPAGALPTLGSSFPLELTDLPGPAGAMILAVGFVQVPIPLPLSLPNCSSGILPDFTVFAPYANGIGSISLTIPSAPALSGLPFFDQAGAIDLNGGEGVSNVNSGILR